MTNGETVVDMGDMGPWTPERPPVQESKKAFKKRVNTFRSSKVGRNIELAVVAPAMWVGGMGYFAGALALKGARPAARRIRNATSDVKESVGLIFAEDRGDRIEPVISFASNEENTSQGLIVTERLRSVVSSIEIDAESVFSGIKQAFSIVRQRPFEGFITGAAGGLTFHDDSVPEHQITLADAGVPIGHQPGGGIQ